MTATAVAAFAKSIEKTYGWLDELRAIAGLDTREKAYQLLRATLHALRGARAAHRRGRDDSLAARPAARGARALGATRPLSRNEAAARVPRPRSR